MSDQIKSGGYPCDGFVDTRPEGSTRSRMSLRWRWDRLESDKDSLHLLREWLLHDAHRVKDTRKPEERTTENWGTHRRHRSFMKYPAQQLSKLDCLTTCHIGIN